MTHTPGPWGVFGLSPTSVGAKDNEEDDCLGRQIAETEAFFGCIIDHDEAIANAKLIVMAPEMLKMCKAAHTVVECLCPTGTEHIRNRWKVIIAKAEGRQMEKANDNT